MPQSYLTALGCQDGNEDSPDELMQVELTLQQQGPLSVAERGDHNA